MSKTALITGITGQDGSYLAELLLFKGYEVHGLMRKASTFNTARIDHLYRDPHDPQARLFLHYGDLGSLEDVANLIYNSKPDEIYNLGAQSHVQVSFEMPEYTGEVTGLGTTRLLEAIRRSGIKTKFYQAASSEMFGNTPPPQSEISPFCPCSPYGVSKLYAYWMTVNYREAYGLWASNGILFNHESPRRGETFVTRKVTRAVARAFAGRQSKLYLGNLAAQRDWGYAPEYVEAMWSMLQQHEAADYVIGTGESHTVQEFVDRAFSYVGLDWREYVEIDQRYFRPAEVNNLRADATKAKWNLEWEPKVTFDELVHILVDADMEAIGLPAIGDGKAVINLKFAGWHGWDSVTSTLPAGMPATLDRDRER